MFKIKKEFEQELAEDLDYEQHRLEKIKRVRQKRKAEQIEMELESNANEVKKKEVVEKKKVEKKAVEIEEVPSAPPSSPFHDTELDVIIVDSTISKKADERMDMEVDSSTKEESMETKEDEAK